LLGDVLGFYLLADLFEDKASQAIISRLSNSLGLLFEGFGVGLARL